MYELKGVHTATFEPHLFSSNVEHCSISNVTLHRILMLKVKARARHAFTLKQNNLF